MLNKKKVVKNEVENLLQQAVDLSELEKKLINRLQGDLPMVEKPFALIAEELNVTESDVLMTLKSLQNRKIMTRFGPLFDIVKKKGALSLCALKVPLERFEQVTNLVNSYPQVAHNYLREHEWNMWFVLAAKSLPELDDVFEEITLRSQCESINCPKQKEFFVGLYLPV